MRRFHLPLIIGAILCSTLAALTLFFRSPYGQTGESLSWVLVIIFLGLVGLAVAFTLSLLLYLTKKLIFGAPDERRATRVAIRQGFWMGLGVFTLGLLKATTTLNVFTLVLTLVILGFLEISFRH